MRAGVPVALADVVATDRATIIFADEISVSGEVRTQGHPITIVCRELTFAPGALIDTSGRPGIPTHPLGLPPATQASPGATGEEGEDGGRGSDAGAVSISAFNIAGTTAIRARGGAGGRGNDGGNGRQGAQGSTGNNATTEASGFPAELTWGAGRLRR